MENVQITFDEFIKNELSVSNQITTVDTNVITEIKSFPNGYDEIISGGEYQKSLGYDLKAVTFIVDACGYKKKKFECRNTTKGIDLYDAANLKSIKKAYGDAKEYFDTLCNAKEFVTAFGQQDVMQIYMSLKYFDKNNYVKGTSGQTILVGKKMCIKMV